MFVFNFVTNLGMPLNVITLGEKEHKSKRKFILKKKL